MRQVFLTCVLSLAILINLPAEAFYIKNYDVKIIQYEDASFIVEENISLFFTDKRRGIIRDIPIIYDVNGKRLKLKVSAVNVQGHKYKTNTSRSHLNIRIGDPDIYLSGDQQYRITYKVENGVISYEDHHEFYWTAIGREWDCEILKSSITYQYPPAWIGQITDASGVYGADRNNQQMLDLVFSENRITSVLASSLAKNEGLTLAVNIPLPLLAIQPDQLNSIYRDNAPVLSPNGKKAMTAIPILIAACLYGLWIKLGGNKEHYDDVPDQYYPMDRMSPAIIGTYYDNQVNNRDLISLIPYWGELGFLKIRPLYDESGDMYFEKLKEISAERPDYEKEFFNELFKNSDARLLSSLKDNFYTTMASVSSKVRKDIFKKDLYHAPSYKVFHSGWMIAAFALLTILGILAMVFLQAILAGIGMIVLGIGCLIIHFVTPRRSEKGKEIYAHLRGFYNFLKDPDPEKLEELSRATPNYLYAMFPYAVAFGIDKTWAKKFKDTTVDPPIWYDHGSYHGAGMGMGTFGRFSQDFNVQKIEQVFYSAPVATHSTGSGGASVGGGFGGGGGSSW